MIEPSAPPFRFLTVREVADQLQVTTLLVRRWIANGELRAFDVGGSAGHRVHPADLERFVNERIAAQTNDGE